MAAPTITTIDPASGPAMADMIVQITGTNFRVPPEPPEGITDGLERITVRVSFGGTVSEWARVLSSTQAVAQVPPHAAGAVNVLLENLDDDGDPIVGESVTRTNGFTYVLQTYTAESESELERVIRTLIRLLKSGLIDEVVLTTDTDFDDETGDTLNVAAFAKIPGIALVGPELDENRMYSLNEQPDFDKPDGTELDGEPAHEFVTTRVPYTCDLRFLLVGVSNRNAELLKLMSATVKFFHRYKYLSMAMDPTDASKGIAKYEMDFTQTGRPRIASTPNASNLRNFTAEIVIRGFDFDVLSGLTDTKIVGIPKHEIVGVGSTQNVANVDPAEATGVT